MGDRRAMNGEMFDLYVETQLIPTLAPDDEIVLDNLSTHKSPEAAKAMKAVGAWFLFLPPRSEPDRNGLRKTQGADPKGSSKDIQ